LAGRHFNPILQQASTNLFQIRPLRLRSAHPFRGLP
jgi:hypothetical protein